MLMKYLVKLKKTVTWVYEMEVEADGVVTAMDCAEESMKNIGEDYSSFSVSKWAVSSVQSKEENNE
jgi:hypothetical protein